MTIKVKPPAWFWVVAVLLLIWELIGVAGFQLDMAMTPEDIAGLDAFDRKLYGERPSWVSASYGVATWTGLLGSIVLLLRQSWARTLYALSLVAIVMLFGWTFVATDIVAAKGLATAAGLPLVIFLLGIVALWFATLARRRGWIG